MNEAMNDAPRQLHGSCHCGAVQFDFDLPAGAPDVRRCNCSLCRRKGAIMLSVAVGQFRISRGADMLTLYQWNHRIARHYFCRVCGIYTHHQRRSNPLEIGVNVGCLEDVNPDQFDTGIMGDGACTTLA
jgi:hypothetical protein